MNLQYYSHDVFLQIEAIVELMQDAHNGIPVRTVKSFISKIPSVFTGNSLLGLVGLYISIIIN